VNLAPKRRLIVLAGASALATAGLVWLAVKASGEFPGWAWAAAASPLATRCLVIMAVGMAALGLAVAILIRARPRVRPAGFRGFFGDQGGTAAIEMAFVFPLGLMIFLVVIQAALVFNANMVVHYSAFAAARMAIVVVPLNLDNDPIFKEKRNYVRNPDVSSVAKSDKLEMIRRAAVMAVMPVSARAASGAATADQGGAAVQNESATVFRYLGVKDERPWFYFLKTKPPFAPFFSRAKSQYDYANSEITLKSPPADSEASSGGPGMVQVTQIELAKPEHWRKGSRDGDCPNPNYPPVWTDAGNIYPPVCPTKLDNGVPDARMDYGYEHYDWHRGHWYDEELYVRVTYQFLLEMPYANRFMGDEAAVPGRSGKQYVTQIRVVVSLMNEGDQELKPRDYEWPPGT
jgi:Flp pilus assembly protein TadG